MILLRDSCQSLVVPKALLGGRQAGVLALSIMYTTIVMRDVHTAADAHDKQGDIFLALRHPA